MTVEEIKESISMPVLVQKYGFSISAAKMINCPFHSDKVASMRVYCDGFFCFSCGAHGDIFDFIRMMDDVSFKEAFQSLGGEYRKPTFSSRMAVYQAQKQRAMRQKAAEREQERRSLNNMLISVYRTYMERSEPLSDVWCDCYNALQYQLYVQAELSGLEARW